MKTNLAVCVIFACATVASGQTCTQHCAISVLTPNNAAVLCAQNLAADPTRALDLSGGVGTGTYYLSLCGNDSVAYTLGVTVIDGPGPDLQVEEVNPNLAEPYLVEVSADGTTWYLVPGPYAGGAWAGDGAIDITGLGTALVNHVRLTDFSAVITGNTPGPDFDAIIAIHYLPPLFGGQQRPYADLLGSYNQGVTITSPYTDGTKALGIPDAYRSESYVGPTTTTFSGAFYNFVSMGQGATLVVGFSSDWVVDGAGGDLLVHEYYSAEGNQFTVEASDDGVHWAPMTLIGSVSPALGTGQPVTNNVQSYDLAGTGFAMADFFRIVSTAISGAGATPGGEVDALEAVNFSPKPRRLTLGTVIAAGATGSVVLSAPAQVGDLVITLPAVTPPYPLGGGLVIGAGAEFRLDLNDPLLNFVAFDPLGPLFVSGIVALLPVTGSTTISVALPAGPGISGIALYWQSGLFPAAGGASTGVSNILTTVIQ